MKVSIHPRVLNGSVEAIPSKSALHRLLICSMLANKPTHLKFRSSSRDIDATAECLRAMGAEISDGERGLYVKPLSSPRTGAVLDCAESGSTLRFLLPIASVLCGEGGFTGRGRLPERPVVDLLNAMEANGVTCSAHSLPFELGGRMHAGHFILPGNVSSQYVSALLMVLPSLVEDSVIELTSALESESYVEITRAVLDHFDVRTEPFVDGRMVVPGGQVYRSPGMVVAPGDWSNAATFLVAGALRSEVEVRGLISHSVQGDRKVLDILRDFGAEVRTGPDWVRVRHRKLSGCTIDISDSPDLLPVLSVLACAAEGRTEFTHAARLRLKESDRLAASAAMISALGGQVEEYPDRLVVTGSTLHGGVVDVRNDHRMVMSAAIAAGLCSSDVIFDGAEAVEKSYPGFFEDLQVLGGRFDVL